MLRIEPLAAESFAKEIGVGSIGKAEHVILYPLPPNRMSASAEGEVAAEIMRHRIICPQHLIGRQRDLVWPLAIDSAGRKLAFTPAHVAP